MPIKKILNKEDLLEIAQFFIEKNYGNNVHIEIEVPDQQTLNKVNEDFFYRLKAENENTSLVEEPEELIINVGGIKFRYFVKEK